MLDMSEHTALVIFIVIPIVANVIAMILRKAGYEKTAAFIEALGPLSINAAKEAMKPTLPPKGNGDGNETLH